MVKFFCIVYQSSPLCRERKWVCAIRVAEGEDGKAKAVALLQQQRGKVFWHEPVQITRARAKELCPSLFKPKPKTEG